MKLVSRLVETKSLLLSLEMLKICMIRTLNINQLLYKTPTGKQFTNLCESMSKWLCRNSTPCNAMRACVICKTLTNSIIVYEIVSEVKLFR